jgi:NAD(P)-dependent dehydrogenase (short-subunit alcohol dehydrogenase family)
MEKTRMKDRKLIVITGVSRGLGRALAEEFMRRGMLVAGCSRSSGAEIRGAYQRPNLFQTVDVRHPSSVTAFAERVTNEMGVPDLLINNAATINRNAPIWELSTEEVGAVFDTNIKGVFHVIHAFVPAMVQRKSGVIVNFSSGWGRSTSPEVAPYCATKYAMEGLTLAMAQELPNGMAAVPLSPGVIDTEMLRSCFGEAADSYPKPEEWAKQAVPFLLGLGPQHNGRSLTVPGGGE